MKFKSDIEVQAGLRDSSGALGGSGQILSSTSGNVSWVTPTVNTVARDVQNQVKAGVAINKGQAVYVTGADGTNIIVGLASNVSEATSSKTLGLLNATVAINGFADVVQIGRLAGLNTLAATVGDPVWLGTGGNLIYGLINKPYAPAHLVFIGVVTRVNVNNGEIFINVQNGFELKEIHDVDLKTTVPINGDILGFDGTLWVNKTIAGWLGYTPANASGTTNYVSKFTGATTLGNSSIFDNGNVGIGTTTPFSKFTTYGALSTSTSQISVVNSEGGHIILRTGISGVSNSGLSLISADVAGTNQNTRLVISSAGNVGIGTIAPSQKLQITQGSSGFPTLGTPAAGALLIAGDSNLYGTYFGIDSNSGKSYLQAMRNDSAVAYSFILNPVGGNIGIGTTAPTVALQIGDTTSGTGSYIKVLGNNTDSTYDVFRGERRYPRFTLKDTVSGGSEFNFWNLGNQMRFGTDTGVLDTAAFVVFSGANGNSQFGGNFAFTNNASKTISINNTLTDVVGRNLTISAGATVAGTAAPNLAGGSLTLRSGLGTGTGDSTIQFQTGTTLTSGLTLQTMSTKMTILGNGNVGIGTATPATLLDVSGVITATGGNSTSWNAKQDAITGAATTITTSNLTASRVLVSDASGKVAANTVTTTTLGYLDATSSIQTQLNGKQGSLTLTTTGSSGAATLVGNTLNIPQYGATPVKLTSQTLTAASWTLVGTYYTYAFSNVNIDTTSDVSVTPQNASYLTAYNAQVLPFVGVAAGVATFYSQFPPTANMTVDIVITQTA